MDTKPIVLNVVLSEDTFEEDENASESKKHASSIHAVWQPDVLNVRVRPESSPATYTRLKFSPLMKATEIRLLRLVRASDGSWADRQPLSLCHADLEHHPEYVCLSYAWGSIDETMPIYLENGQYLMVTKSLGELLYACNTMQKEVLFWTDQICIDQYNLEERASQVRMMSSIYKQAHMTSVWLGIGDEHGTAAFNVIEMCQGEDISFMALTGSLQQSNFMGAAVDHSIVELVTQRIHPSRDSIIQNYKRKFKSKVQGKNVRDPLQPHEWAAFESVLNKPWFSRLWVFQEYVVSKDVVFLYGPYNIQAAQIFKSLALLPTPTYYKLPTGWHTMYEFVMCKLEYQSSKPDLLRLLYASRMHFQCSDPRDRIFALLSLADEVGVPINYSVSVLDLYSSVTTFLINKSQRLDVLELLREDADNIEVSFPSWTPDYNQDQLIPTIDIFGLEEKRFSASGGFLHISHAETSSLHLTVRGRIVDKLLGILSPEPIARRDVPDDTVNLGEIFLLPEILNYLEKRIASDRSSLRTSTCVKRLILQTITCDGFSRDDRNTASPPNDEEVDTLWEVLCNPEDVIMNDVTIKFQEWQNQRSKASPLLKVARKLRRQSEADAFQSYSSSSGQEKLMRSMQMSQWTHAQTLNCEGRVIIASKRSNIILGPARSQPNDLVCILAGSTVPWVVRSKKNTENQYQLIGPCFAEGVMYGEKAHRMEQDMDTFVLV